MTSTATSTIQTFLAGVAPFDQLPTSALAELASQFKPQRYRMGQVILTRDKMPVQIAVVFEGQARLLGFAPGAAAPLTLQRLGPGAACGWAGLVRGVPCEGVLASTEVVCLMLDATTFLAWLDREPVLAAVFRDRPSLVEVFDLLGAELERQARGSEELKALALQAWPEAVVSQVGESPEPGWLWLISSGPAAGNRWVAGAASRLVGLRPSGVLQSAEPPTGLLDRDIPYAPELSDPDPDPSEQYPFVRGRGPLESTLACFQMLCTYLKLPLRREVLRRVLLNRLERNTKVSLALCGTLAELAGLNAQLVKVPASALARLETPALVEWRGVIALLYRTGREFVLAVPEEGIQRLKPADFVATWGEQGQVLLLKPDASTPKKRFGLGWFVPAVRRHRKVLLEVLVASFFVQLFALANPLMTQVIIDKVLVQNAVDTLNVLGVFLLGLAVFEAILTSLRAYLFADTTNRIDLELGSEVIDHLLRLSLRYFERRPTGELTTRVNELENIRQFLTGTALTTVLDAVFSVLYILIMLSYSWLLTLVALATVPLFALMTLVASPIIRRQLRTRAERYAETQSLLVETLSGIQTVKAQNIELHSRWQWQERYARYVSAGFTTVLTSATVGSIGHFLAQFSGLLLLWVGAYLVLAGQLTLGQLIAFRIIAGYVTSPLLRLVQLWQRFQEVGLSIERLGDILDSPQESDGARQIPMPRIEGRVQYEEVCFRYSASGAPQLTNICLDLPAGSMVGIVGQSGSGKSTLTRLLARLYPLDTGRILVDGYDIAKVELYSLRRQLGVVLQDTLLFDGTVQENIALANPDATAEEVIATARIACAHDFVMGLADGYNTRVGERGMALSGGQRQRIALARTVLQDPRLLILDEATSALDYPTERQVCSNLMQAFRGRTVLVVTHRLEAIRQADIILVMERGSVVERGTHTELLALKGRYYCLYQQQEVRV